MRKFFLYIVVLLNFLALQNVQSSIVFFNNKEFALKTVRFNSIEYVEVNYLTKILFPDAIIKDNSIFINQNNIIKLANSSFFISIKKNDDLKISQMNLPILEYKNLYYVPLEAFLKVLETNQIIKYDKILKYYFIEDNLFNEERILQPILNNIDVQRDKNKSYNENNNQKQDKKIDKNNQLPQNDDNILKPVYRKLNEENKYIIPEDIKKNIKK